MNEAECLTQRNRVSVVINRDDPVREAHCSKGALKHPSTSRLEKACETWRISGNLFGKELYYNQFCLFHTATSWQWSPCCDWVSWSMDDHRTGIVLVSCPEKILWLSWERRCSYIMLKVLCNGSKAQSIEVGKIALFESLKVSRAATFEDSNTSCYNKVTVGDVAEWVSGDD